jgi:hypothetical protein
MHIFHEDLPGVGDGPGPGLSKGRIKVMNI